MQLATDAERQWQHGDVRDMTKHHKACTYTHSGLRCVVDTSPIVREGNHTLSTTWERYSLQAISRRKNCGAWPWYSHFGDPEILRLVDFENKGNNKKLAPIHSLWRQWTLSETRARSKEVHIDWAMLGEWAVFSKTLYLFELVTETRSLKTYVYTCHDI